MQCEYNAKLFKGNFQCSESALDGKQYCRFHDYDYWKNNWESYSNEVHSLITTSISEGTDLDLIGYHIPEFEWHERLKINLRFDFSTFEEKVNFSNTSFEKSTSFYYTTFNNVADFIDTTFVRRPIFYHSTFKDDVKFIATIFEKGANFYESVFLKFTDFWNSKFMDFSFMPGMKFYNKVNFSGAEFYNKTEFSRTEFNFANFSHADFHGEVNFSNIKFPKLDFSKVKKSSFEIPIKFNYATIRERFRILGKPGNPVNLECVSFLGVDIKNVEFSNVKWLQLKVSPWSKVIIDEYRLKFNNNYEEVSNIYGQLRKNYESRLRFTEASNFFVGEMDTIKQGLQNGAWYEKFSAIPYFFYKYLALYGESYTLPLALWAPVLIIVFSSVRITFDICSLPTECNVIGQITDSLSAFFLFPRSNSLIDIAERLLSIPVLGTAFVALKRKFERRK